MKKLEEENKAQKKESIEIKTARTESQKASGESQDGIRQAESNASRIEESSIRAGGFIGESQSILSGIREGEKRRIKHYDFKGGYY